MEYRFIVHKDFNGFMNMAVDEAIMLNNKPTIRLYTWKTPFLSIGYFQDPGKDINISYCRNNNIGIVRRITGGMAVLHDMELTYSFIVPKEQFPYDLIESYKYISEPIVFALSKMGMDIRSGNKKEKKDISPICFEQTNWYEPVVHGRKIIGSAQTRRGTGILQHGSIPFDINYEQLASCFNNIKSNQQHTLKEKFTSLGNELNRDIDINEVIHLLKLSFEEKLNVTLISGELTDYENTTARELFKTKYTTDNWNFNRNRSG